MIALGIESTAHTFGIGIVDSKGKVLANEKDTLKPKDKGLIPRELAEHHFQVSERILRQALDKAEVKLSEIDLIGFSQGPGIGNALRIGATVGRALSLKLNKPLAPVNHCIAHIEIGKKKTKAKDPVVVYASGANTQIITLSNERYRIFGETLDIGIGNMMDSFGRELGLGFPAGPILDQWYFLGKKYIPLPYTVKGSDLVFSGLQTAAERMIGKETQEDLAYSLLHTGFAMLTEVTERVLAHTGKKEVLLVGGVAASKALNQMMDTMCEERNAKKFVPEVQFCTDNGAMIAWTTHLVYKSQGKISIKESEIKPKQRTDDVVPKWIQKK
ncbi:MAG: KEOPS complex N(6)-L-threonylcarbamoyladenine synthase Kae1 [Candidatus Diapherotrites archaeon]|nr:KEOPS complex N(6)-L-threonylcarbamoyladenine synthase Kae1 [Candidatus Diapherotrites archaeon]